MRKRADRISIVSFFCAVLAALFVCTAVFAKTEETVPEILEQIVLYEEQQAEVEDVQSLLDIGLVPFAGTSFADWIVINLASGKYPVDADRYLAALEEYVAQPENTAVMKATDYERIGLCFAAFGENETWIAQVIDTQTGAYGIMSEIYGLILYGSGDYQTALSGTDIAKMILERQLDGGGFGLSENMPDPDVTAMALQALAPYAEIYEEQIDGALGYLSAVQMESGGYQSFGTENAESAAQVLLALCALGIDYRTDARFIKNENDLFDVLISYRCDDGGFAHILGGDSNSIATYQVWAALLQIQEKFLQTQETETQTEGTIQTEYLEEQTGAAVTGKQIGIWLTAAVWAAAGVIAAVLIVRKKFRLRVGLILAGIAAALTVFFQTADIETAKEYYARGEGALLDGAYETTLCIQGYEQEILSETTVMVSDGDTVFDQLLKATAAYGISLDYSGSALLQNVYVRSVDGLSEFDFGERSGWMYTVNGTYPQVGAAAYVLQENDAVCWIYTDGGQLP